MRMTAQLSVLASLYRLLRKGYEWAKPEGEAFAEAKKLLTSSQLFVYYEPALPLVLACDASSYGIGAVLSHKLSDGSKRPIAFASRTLSGAEQKYAQLEKEGLACIFGIKKFHSYLYGRPFEICTDHKPLATLFSRYKPTSQHASARIQRWALILADYDYSLVVKSSEANSNADALSRLPLAESPAQTEVPEELILLVEHISQLPITSEQIKTWTHRDPVLSQVEQFTYHGWPESCPNEELRLFWQKRHELSIHDGCLLWGSWVVVPNQGRRQVLLELHQGHQGCTRMKSLARMYVWWPGLDADIDNAVKGCERCQKNQSDPAATAIEPWKWPAHPWSWLHLDFAGPFLGKQFLVIVVHT